MKKNSQKTALKTTMVAVATAGLMGLGAAAASAHVSVSASSTASNSYSLLTFSVPHGCSGSATTKIAISLPENIDDATPTVNPNWVASKVTTKLAQPKTLENGSQVTEKTSQVVYTVKTPLDPAQRDALVLSLKLPDASGSQLNFPVLRSCEKGETNWAQTVQPGQDHDAVKDPAPSITLTAAAAEDAHSGHSAPTPAAATQDSGSQAPGWIGLGAGIAGLLLGAFALFRTRNKASKTLDA
ncbi:putative exported protein [Renibacterium salmoninarum ATCC 33209]|uniref:Putative exported protein n=1 Tax=Renibacterium salmoninarum (strain ATCC 33209 / DSM 20767 / JCM 11484 / NBRC 15589 / NCIMB 2235) TaxID=288705 RepID=A9WLP7_RENSM|nr:YcnI family protein [Renibacterium salmoninarum]ABY21827.1 putative exported protein [Renibacterium salmoninarum ATCC 33209]